MGHTVIIPKIHTANIITADDALLAPIFLTTKRVAGILQDALHPEGFTIGINHGGVSGQTVPHLHVHVIPRYNGDGGGSIHSVVNAPAALSLEEVALKLAKKN